MKAGFLLPQLRNAGWNISKSYKSWKNTKKILNENEAGDKIKEKRGKKKLSESIKMSVKNFVTSDIQALARSYRQNHIDIASECPATRCIRA